MSLSIYTFDTRMGTFKVQKYISHYFCMSEVSDFPHHVKRTGGEQKFVNHQEEEIANWILQMLKHYRCIQVKLKVEIEDIKLLLVQCYRIHAKQSNIKYLVSFCICNTFRLQLRNSYSWFHLPAIDDEFLLLISSTCDWRIPTPDFIYLRLTNSYSWFYLPAIDKFLLLILSTCDWQIPTPDFIYLRLTNSYSWFHLPTIDEFLLLILSTCDWQIPTPDFIYLRLM